MDATDRRILRALHRRARLTNAELAEEVGLSPSPCWTRVRRLEAAGVIQGYVAILDQAAAALRDDEGEVLRNTFGLEGTPILVGRWGEGGDAGASAERLKTVGH